MLGRAKKCFTVCLHYGGKFTNQVVGEPTYDWGKARKWDYVQLKELTVELINGFCDEVRVGNMRKFHVHIEDA